tara:strand:+ start:86 stop:1087 length:1002 start_codon:yes stop_codon:yes gene_type:complete
MLKNKKFKSLIEKIDDGIIIVDSNYDILHANTNAKEYLGDMIIGRPIYNILRNDEVIDAISDQKDINKHFQFTTSSNRIIEVTHVQNYAKLGYLLLKDKSKALAFENIRRELVANVSHELRSPLTTISGFIETLQNENLERDQLNRFLNIMQEEANRMSRIVSDLLSLSKIEINLHSKPKEKINITDQIKIAIDALEIVAIESQKKINLNVSEDIFFTKVIGDSDEIVEVFHNIIENAIKYSFPNTDIDVLVYLEESYLCVEVSNMGHGIPDEHIPRVTERFYRVDKSRSRDIGGTGLGLAIVKNILIRHNATLKIDSKVDEKTTFKILFPCL